MGEASFQRGGPSLGLRMFSTHGPAAVMLIRLLVGAVFLSEGIQKFLFPDERGVGRFIGIGIPVPEVTAPFVGIIEVACGGLVLLGLATRLAAIPLVIDMIVAILTTKVPLLSSEGFWAMAHEGRTDWSMLFGSLFLLIVGGGSWSLDAQISPGSRSSDGS